MSCRAGPDRRHDAGVTREEASRLLGVRGDEDEKIIRRAFHRVASRVHPDRPDGDEARYRRAVEAYRLLCPSHDDDVPARGADVEDIVVVPLSVAVGGGSVRVRGASVTVPPHTAPDDVLVLRGLGGGGNPPGDLRLRVVLGDGEGWSVDGRDLRGELPVSLLEWLGRGLVSVDLPGGRATIPLADIELDEEIVLMGFGLGREAERGDVVLVPRLVLPGDDATLRSVLLRLQGEAGSAARARVSRAAGVS